MTSGVRGASQVSPKAIVVLSPTPLTRSLGYEVGARSRLFERRLEVAAALWGIDLDSETVWVGDTGTTESAGATRRLGVELDSTDARPRRSSPP
jgi:outer membrane receptor for monomeric catechols